MTNLPLLKFSIKFPGLFHLYFQNQSFISLQIFLRFPKIIEKYVITSSSRDKKSKQNVFKQFYSNIFVIDSSLELISCIDLDRLLGEADFICL